MKLNFSFCFKIFVIWGVLTITNTTYAQTVIVDNNYTGSELVDLLLSNSCATSSNIQISSNKSVAYFNNNGGNFPINQGIIIRSGDVLHTAGPYTGSNLDSPTNLSTDQDLQQISNQTGQSSLIRDAAFLTFNFTPSSTFLSFDFIFASNEYGEWQCGFSDVFGFLLTDLITGETTNLAILPNSKTPISVRDIRDSEFNRSCNSVNPELFDKYNVNHPDDSSINMRGQTVLLNASSEVKPNNPYRIKLVIGDYNDSNFDSAVFIKSGSFDTFLDLGPDVSMCSGDSVVLDAEYTDTQNFIYTWYRNGVIIPSQISPTLKATSEGTYKLEVTAKQTGCVLSDEIEVTEFSIANPPDLIECFNEEGVTFNLTVNNINSLGLSSEDFELKYYKSIADINNNSPIESSLLTNYPSNGSETIYMKITKLENGLICDDLLSFNLEITEFEIGIPENIEICEGTTSVNLPLYSQSSLLNGLNPQEYGISYFTTETDATNNLNSVEDPQFFEISIGQTEPISIWARLSANKSPECFELANFNIIVVPKPLVDSLQTIYECTQYELPELEHGDYYTGPNGTGNKIDEGEIIYTNTTLYIFSVNDLGCTNQTSFKIRMADEYNLTTNYCGEFIIPSYPNAKFYSETGGENGSGNLLESGTKLTESQTIYFYALDSNSDFCVEKPFNITINPIPEVDSFEDVITCNSYILPNTTHGSFYTKPNGKGLQLVAGSIITSTQNLYVYNKNSSTGCDNQSEFKISIIDTQQFKDINACGSYVVPSQILGNYFTEVNGTGDVIPSGTVLDSSQTIYFYAETTSNPNCTENISIDITIHPIPEVDELPNITKCEDNPYKLPSLQNGKYFTDKNGNGTQLHPNELITSSQTIYIFNSNEYCTAETSFKVTIKPFPEVDNFTDVFTCEPYTLPELNKGKYYTESGGVGTEIVAGTVITETQTIYIYNNYDDLVSCYSENVFTVNILGVTVDKLEDIAACNSYELLPLTNGEYYSEPSGYGHQLFAGDIITETTTLYIYKSNGSRFYCEDQDTFTISISQTPEIPELEDLEGCGSVTLQDIFIENAKVSFYRKPEGIDPISSSDLTISEEGSYRIFVRAHSVDNENCIVETSFDVNVYPLLDLNIKGGTICVDPKTKTVTNPILLESGLPEDEFEVLWYLNNELVGKGSDYLATEEGTFTVETLKLTRDSGGDCNYKSTQVEVTSNSPEFEIEFLTHPFDKLSNIRINVTNAGTGNYLYSLNGSNYQESNLFHDVPVGIHEISVIDQTKSCSSFDFKFTALNFPKFFTPNNDGINDYWNILDLASYPDAIIHIFNRMGRLVAVIKPSQQGWNGMNNSGKKEKSSDYWFKVQFTFQGELATFASHFSLIRN